MASRTRTKETVQVELKVVNGQKYAFHRFPEGLGPTLAGAIEYAKGKGEMLTLDEARAIIDNADSNAVFKASLKPGEWSYVRDEYSESRSRAAYLDHPGGGRLLAGRDVGADVASRVVVLKVGREAAAPQIEVVNPTEKLMTMLRDGDLVSRLSVPERLEGIRALSQEIKR